MGHKGGGAGKPAAHHAAGHHAAAHHAAGHHPKAATPSKPAKATTGAVKSHHAASKASKQPRTATGQFG